MLSVTASGGFKDANNFKQRQILLKYFILLLNPNCEAGV